MMRWPSIDNVGTHLQGISVMIVRVKWSQWMPIARRTVADEVQTRTSSWCNTTFTIIYIIYPTIKLGLLHSSKCHKLGCRPQDYMHLAELVLAP